MEKTKKNNKENRNKGLFNHPATFMIKIIYSKNTSVQGYLHWLENEKSVPFRSYMELTYLINEALNSNELIKFRSWQTDAKQKVKDFSN